MKATVRIQEAEILDVDEPVSKALDAILRTGTCVVITKNGEYYGIIDDRNIRGGITNPKNFKCASAAIRAPRIKEEEFEKEDVESILHKFLAGHFKALPIVKNENGKEKPIGIITRADVLKFLASKGYIPNISVNTIMSTPIYSIEVDETLGTLKKLMKTLKVHRFAVVEKGRLVGIISSFDLTMFIEKPRDRQTLQLIDSTKRPDTLKIKQFIREPLVTCREVDMLPVVVNDMVEHNVSYAVVTDDKRSPIGIISATDVFKLVLRMIKPRPAIYISGLRGEDMYYYEEIGEIIRNVLNKFSKQFDFGDVSIRIKKGKSTHIASLFIEVDGEPIHIKGGGYNIEEAIDEVAYTLEKQLRKIKNMRDKGKRHTPTVELVGEGEYI